MLVEDVRNKVLLSPALRPAACRSAISRAYYAAFLVAHEFLDRIKVVVGQGPQTHVTVQHALNNSGHRLLAETSSKLGTLHSGRLAADYDPHKTAPEDLGQATWLLALARDVIDQLDQLTAGTSPMPFDAPTAAAAILNWAAITSKTNVKPK